MYLLIRIICLSTLIQMLGVNLQHILTKVLDEYDLLSIGDVLTVHISGHSYGYHNESINISKYQDTSRYSKSDTIDEIESEIWKGLSNDKIYSDERFVCNTTDKTIEILSVDD